MAKKKDNVFIVEDDVVKMEITRRNGDKFYCLIDLDDYERVKNFPYSWHVNYMPDIDDYYISACVYEKIVNGKIKNRNYMLHTFIANIEEKDGVRVDHINHNTMDNRKSNLRVVEGQKNSTNRNGRNRNNQSGYRNVSKVKDKWIVQLQINGKNTKLGSFALDKLEEAGAFAKEMRKKYYGEYCGNDDTI